MTSNDTQGRISEGLRGLDSLFSPDVTDRAVTRMISEYENILLKRQNFAILL